MLKVAQALTADTTSSSEVESSLIGTEDLFSNKALHNNLGSGQHPISSIVNKQPTERGPTWKDRNLLSYSTRLPSKTMKQVPRPEKEKDKRYGGPRSP